MAHEISQSAAPRHARGHQTNGNAGPTGNSGGIVGKGALVQMAQMGITLGLSPIFLHNSRVAESEADLLGTDIMYDSGYDPHQMAVFFTKLEKEMGKSTLVDQFFSDHPIPVIAQPPSLGKSPRCLPKPTLPAAAIFPTSNSLWLGMKPFHAES